MPGINDISNTIPNINVNGNYINVRGIRFINPRIKEISDVQVNTSRIWLTEPPQAIPPVVPVTEIVGTPIVNMPGCVKVHKENAQKDPSRNKMLVNDDPKQNVVLCDNGMPYYEPPDYDYRELTWTTVNTEPEEAEGVNTGEPPAPEFNSPEPPNTGGATANTIECPPPNARRIGDLSQNGEERVKEYKLTPDGLICETIWEPVPTMDQFLPSVPVVSTTATIAAVATTSALLAKPLADLLLKVVKPVVKKTIAKVKEKFLGKIDRRPNRSERMSDQYREKKGLPPLKKKRVK